MPRSLSRGTLPCSLALITLFSLGVGAAAPTPNSRGSDDLEALRQRAEAARESGRFQEAIPLYQGALEQDDTWKEGWWYLGTIYYELHRFEEARDGLRRLVVLDPEAGPAWALLGLCEYQVREYDRALKSLHRGSSLGMGADNPLRQVAEYHRALLLNRFEQFEAAFELLYRMVREHPSHPKIIEALGISVTRSPFLPVELPADQSELVLQAGGAAALHATGRAEEAAQQYAKILERYPQTPGVHYAYGVFLLGSRPDAALEHFQKELEISPFHLEARLQIAFEYLRRGEAERGRPFAEDGIKLDPDSFLARNALGRILLDLGEVERAIQELETAVRLAADSADMRFALAQAYARAGRTEEARRERAEFLRLDRERRASREGAQAVGGLLPPEEF